MANYLWRENLTPPDFQALQGDIETDVLIIGGGMAGVLCALKLKEAGVRFVLAEGEKIGGAITKGTTAVLTAQHDTLYQDMINKFGKEKSKLYLEANLHAVERFRALSQMIPCDFEEKPSLMFSLADRALLEREVKALKSLGFEADLLSDSPLPFQVAGAVRYQGMAEFHPLKFLYGAADRLPIYENTFVRQLKGTTALTDRGSIRANKVVIATHYPFINRHGMYFMKLYQQRSYVIAFENAPDIGCTIMDAAENGVYLRNYGKLLLIGGGDHRTGRQGGGYQTVRDFAAQYFPGCKEKYAWSNQDTVSLDGVPYIGCYSTGEKDIYAVSGFNLWGMTSAMAAADILADMVTGKQNKYAPAFAPQRSMLTAQLFSNLGTTSAGFLTPTAKRCSHLGCALKWNDTEQSWDCPCHGSRFDKNGGLIDNPAMRGAKVKG